MFEQKWLYKILYGNKSAFKWLIVLYHLVLFLIIKMGHIRGKDQSWHLREEEKYTLPNQGREEGK